MIEVLILVVDNYFICHHLKMSSPYFKHTIQIHLSILPGYTGHTYTNNNAARVSAFADSYSRRFTDQI